MKKITKILSLFFVAAIALVLAACGKTEAPNTTKAPATTTAQPATTTAAPANTTTQAPAVTTTVHTRHEYGDTYEKDADGHWKVCTICGQASAVEDHEFSVEEVRPTLDTEGSKTYTCDVCGYTYTENTGLAKVWAVGDESYLLDYTSKQTDPHFTTLEYSEDGKTVHLVASADYSWNAIIAYCSGTTEGYALEITVTTPATATKAANFCIKPNDSMEKWASAPVGETKTYSYYGDQVPAEMATMVVMAASAEVDGYLSMKWVEMKPQLVDPELYIVGNGYYNSTDSTRYNILIDNDTTAQKFVATRFFTKDMLPVGSVLEIAEGYQYRPEGWKDENKQTSRLDNVKTARVVIDDTWWGDYIKRAFNISKTDGSLLTSEDAYAAAVAAFKIYLPYGQTLKPMVKEDVNLIADAPTTTNGHVYTNYLNVIKNSGTGYEYVGIKVNNDLTGYTKVVATVQGTAGESIMFKANDNGSAEHAYTMDGTLQTIEFDLPEGFVFDSSKNTMVLFPNNGVAGTKHPFHITKLELQGEGKTAIDLLVGNVSCAMECEFNKEYVVYKPATIGEWDCFKINVDGDFTGYAAVKYTVQGTAGEQIMFKINDQQEVWVKLTGEVQSGVILVTATYDKNKDEMVVFCNPGVAGTGNPVVIYELTYCAENPTKTITPSSTASSGASYCSFNEAKTIATLVGIPDGPNGGKWGRWDYSLTGCSSYKKIVVVLKVTAGLAVQAKIDSSSTPANNAYDSMTGNKTTKTAGEDGMLTFEWDFATFAANAQAAGKAFDIENLTKFVFFAGWGEGATKTDSATIELVSITLVK